MDIKDVFFRLHWLFTPAADNTCYVLFGITLWLGLCKPLFDYKEPGLKLRNIVFAFVLANLWMIREARLFACFALLCIVSSYGGNFAVWLQEKYRESGGFWNWQLLKKYKDGFQPFDWSGAVTIATAVIVMALGVISGIVVAFYYGVESLINQ